MRHPVPADRHHQKLTRDAKGKIRMKRLGKTIWTLGAVISAGTLALLLVYVAQPPGSPEPRELYEVVTQHLEACRTEDFPLAYHAAASGVQERLSLVQFERKLRADWQPVARAHHVEFGPARPVPGQRGRATVEVYFVLDRRGETIARRYHLVREGEDWKVDRSEAVAGWPDGPRVRMAGRRA